TIQAVSTRVWPSHVNENARAPKNHVDELGRPASGKEMDQFSCHEGQESERSPPSRQVDILLGGDRGKGYPQTGRSVRRKLVPYNIKRSTGAVGLQWSATPHPP
ncbi:unnamed protein product, partial [Ectocarpus sp. 13 AM-2016]